MQLPLSRREWFATTSAVAIGSQLEAAASESKSSFGYCLNSSTIRGQKLPIEKEVELAAKVGFNAIEPWINELQDHQKAGKSLKDLGKFISDSGLKVPSAIGFAQWIVDSDEERKKGFEQAKRDMDMVQQIGGTHIAAPPVGATNQTNLDLIAAADRYRKLLELGQSMGVIPEIEVWGFSKSLRRLGEILLVAVESGSAKACVLPDIYHLYKGGSSFETLSMMQGSLIGIFHVNDYPKIERDKIGDADRIYPGDGIAPVVEVLKTLKKIGYQGYLSLELFNRTYWMQDAEQVLKTGLAKMKAVVEKANG
jgi:2-keto-myo-inositol isomerase